MTLQSSKSSAIILGPSVGVGSIVGVSVGTTFAVDVTVTSLVGVGCVTACWLLQEATMSAESANTNTNELLNLIPSSTFYYFTLNYGYLLILNI
jgi:uncharacterized membrane protein (Fun14 family)